MTGWSAVRSPDHPGPGSPVPRVVLSALAVVGMVIAVVLVAPLCRPLSPPPLVDHISFVNGTEYDLRIEVTDAKADGWVTVGTSGRGQTTTMEDIVDQGATWVFRFAGQGKHGGELRMSRSQLERDGWKVAIPTAIGEALRAKGAGPSP